MFLNVEKIEDFFMLLEAEANSKEEKDMMPVFIGKNTAVSEKGVCIGEIVIQYQYDTDMVVVFRTSEGIDPIVMPNVGFVNALEFQMDKTTSDQLRSKAKSKEDVFNNQVDVEYKKAIEVLKTKGFTSIVPGLWI